MSFKSSLLAGAFALLPSLVSAHMVVNDPYARAATPTSISGAAFMEIFNHSDQDDRLIRATSDVAERVELHTHVMEEGVMRMVEIDEGIEIPAGETVLLQRGGMHVMFLGLTRSLSQGDTVTITLEFEHAEPVTVTLPVDLNRQPAAGGHGGHGDHSDHSGHGDHSGHAGHGTDG